MPNSGWNILNLILKQAKIVVLIRRYVIIICINFHVYLYKFIKLVNKRKALYIRCDKSALNIRNILIKL